MVPVGEWAKDRLSNLSDTDKVRDESKVGSGFGKKIANWIGRDMVYPNSVIHMATECANRSHSATFPVELPAWFIKLFTEPGDIVLDPFMGSGATLASAIRLGRNFAGIDISEEYVDLALRRTDQEQIRLSNIA